MRGLPLTLTALFAAAAVLYPVTARGLDGGRTVHMVCHPKTGGGNAFVYSSNADMHGIEIKNAQDEIIFKSLGIHTDKELLQKAKDYCDNGSLPAPLKLEFFQRDMHQYKCISLNGTSIRARKFDDGPGLKFNDNPAITYGFHSFKDAREEALKRCLADRPLNP